MLSAVLDRRICPLWVKSRHGVLDLECLLYPQKRTLIGGSRMSALCQTQTSEVLIDPEDVLRADALGPYLAVDLKTASCVPKPAATTLYSAPS